MRSKKLLQHKENIVLVTIVIAGLILRLYHVDYKWLRFDELCTFARLSASFGDMLKHLAHSPFPPLYYIIMKVWTSLLGNSELYNRLRHAGLQRASEFTWRETARQTVRVYEEAASG